MRFSRPSAKGCSFLSVWRKFDLEDTRVLTALANFAAAGFELVSALERRRSVADGERKSVGALVRGSLMPAMPAIPAGDAQVKREALSKREFEVMSMMVRGVTQKEIGFALQISVKTVATHRARVLRKLNLNGSFDLLRYALQNRLVEWGEVH